MSTAFFDPGLSGAIAIHHAKPQSGAWRVWDLPLMGMGKQMILNGAALAAILRTHAVDHAVIERVHAWPGGGVAGMFRFGTTFGQILGVVQALELSYELVEPSKWKREMRLPGGEGKGEMARGRALELLPHMAADLSRKKDHNRAEALLIGLWWMKGQKEWDKETSRRGTPRAKTKRACPMKKSSSTSRPTRG